MELRMQNLTKEFGDFTAVDHLNFTMENGVYGLLGVNGAGKTTLMKMLCTLLSPTSGEITCNGREILGMGADYRRILGYLPQEFGFYPEFTVQDYLSYIAALKGLRPVVAKRRVQELIEKTGLKKAAKKKMKKLSGGMKRRAGIAQAMLNNPKILVLDEPTAGLDPKGRDEILDLIAGMQKERNMTVILVSHSMEDVANYVNRMLVMKEGSVLFDGAPKEVFSHYKELEAVSLAAPQVTYLMNELRESGMPVNADATTIEEAKQEILRAFQKKGKVC